MKAFEVTTVILKGEVYNNGEHKIQLIGIASPAMFWLQFC